MAGNDDGVLTRTFNEQESRPVRHATGGITNTLRQAEHCASDQGGFVHTLPAPGNNVRTDNAATPNEPIMSFAEAA